MPALTDERADAIEVPSLHHGVSPPKLSTYSDGSPACLGHSMYRTPRVGGEPGGVRPSCFSFALLAPECIAGSVKKDEPSLGIGIGHRGVGLPANQARVRQGSFNADPPYPLRGRKSPACQR